MPAVLKIRAVIIQNALFLELVGLTLKKGLSINHSGLMLHYFDVHLLFRT